jgi:tetrahydromethanopterin S-methyltransferase subunit F
MKAGSDKDLFAMIIVVGIIGLFIGCLLFYVVIPAFFVSTV